MCVYSCYIRESIVILRYTENLHVEQAVGFWDL